MITHHSKRATNAEKASRRPFFILRTREPAAVRLAQILAAVAGEFVGARAPSRRFLRAVREAGPLVEETRRPGRTRVEFRLGQAVRDALFFKDEFHRDAAVFGLSPDPACEDLAARAAAIALLLREAAVLAAASSDARLRLERVRVLLREARGAYEAGLAEAFKQKSVVQVLKTRELVRHLLHLLESMSRCVRPLEDFIVARTRFGA